MTKRADQRKSPDSDVPRHEAAGPHVDGSRSRDALILCGILLVGLVLRSLYLAENKSNPDFASPAVDAGFHDYWARGLAFGQWTPPGDADDPGINQTPFLRPPGYPYFLSVVYRIAGLGSSGGAGYLAPRLVQIALGLLNCALLFVIGRRWFCRATGLIAAGMMAVYWVFIYFEQELHAPALLVSLLLLAVYVLGRWAEKPAFGRSLGAGLLLGLAALVRPTVLLILPVGAAWMLYVCLRRRCPGRIVGGVAALLLGTVLAVSPATIRNYLVARDFVAISSNGGVNLFIGNNESATGYCVQELPGFGQFGTCYDYPHIVAEVERREGRKLKASEVSAFFTRQALDFIRHNPAATAALTGKKALLLLGPRELGHNKIVECERQASVVLRHLPGNFALVLSLGLLGLAGQSLDWWRRKRTEPDTQPDPPPDTVRPNGYMPLLIVLVIVALSVAILPFFVTARYRVPIVPFLMLFAADGLYRVIRSAAARQLQTAIVLAVVWAGLFVLVGHQFVPYEPDRADWHFKRARAFDRTGRGQEAVEEYRQALEMDPRFARANYNLANALAQQGHVQEAVKYYGRTLQVKPDHVKANNNLGNMLAILGRLDEAMSYYNRALELQPDQCDVHRNLGVVLSRQNKLAEAARHYESAIALCPTMAVAYLELGQVLLRQQKIGESIPRFLEAVRLDPKNADAHHYLGLARARQGRLDEAADSFRKALELDPARAVTQALLGNTFKLQGRLDEAADAYRRALQINPGLTAARQALLELEQNRQ